MLKNLLKSLASYLIILVILINVMKIISEDLLIQNTEKMIGTGRMSTLKIKQIDKLKNPHRI
jgi:hypothetical protein